jgi:hypothetical protein
MTRSRVVIQIVVSLTVHSSGDGPLGSGKPTAKKMNVVAAMAA